MMVPPGCEVQIPPEAFEPWEVYKVLKTSTHKITTPPKLEMGGQTLNMTNLDVRASGFRCQKVHSEWRAVALNKSSNVANIALHDAIAPLQFKAQCHLSAISLYQSESGIPGLRLDYENCAFGVAKQATILVGLKKVPDDVGSTPGLAAFFQDVCGEQEATVRTLSGSPADVQLRFDLIPSAMQPTALGTPQTCFAVSASMQLFTSYAHPDPCFEPAMVFTLLDINDHFPVFPVKDSEWDWMLSQIPKPKQPLAAASTDFGPTPPPDPCGPEQEAVWPKVYGNVIADRVCMAFPDLGCDNDCGKTCVVKKILSIDTTPAPSYPSCVTCYDCELDEAVYAILATFLVFNICNIIYRSSLTERVSSYTLPHEHTEQISSGAASYASMSSFITQPHIASHASEGYSRAFMGFGFLSLIVTIFVYILINILNHMVVVVLMKKEMCVKLFSFETNLLLANNDWKHAEHWGLLTGSNTYECHNEPCPGRLLGLILATWLSLWCLFAYWRWNWVSKLTTMTMDARAEENEHGAGGAAGTGAGSLLMRSFQSPR